MSSRSQCHPCKEAQTKQSVISTTRCCFCCTITIIQGQCSKEATKVLKSNDRKQNLNVRSVSRSLMLIICMGNRHYCHELVLGRGICISRKPAACVLEMCKQCLINTNQRFAFCMCVFYFFVWNLPPLHCYLVCTAINKHRRGLCINTFVFIVGVEVHQCLFFLSPCKFFHHGSIK